MRRTSSSPPSRRSVDDRLWYPDLNDHLDWSKVWLATQRRYSASALATWWVQATEGVNYYRAELPARHLPGKTVRLEADDVHPGAKPEFHAERRFERQEGETAVWLFPGNKFKGLAMARMKAQGYRVLVEVDDNYTVHPAIPGLSSWRIRTDDTPSDEASYEMHKRIVRNELCCDGVIVSTPRLADVYRRLHANVHVCRNSVDPADWDPEPEHQPDGVLRVGWAGSASHGYDLADIRQALDWASRQKDVEVVILGQLGLTGFGYRQVPWTDSLAEYRKNVQQVDVMLCPLRSNEWADCKSDAKALEATMGGACVVVSRTEPYRPWWAGEAPGYSAARPKDFLRVLKHLVARRDEVRETARLARDYVLRERNIVQTVSAWREAIECA